MSKRTAEDAGLPEREDMSSTGDEPMSMATAGSPAGANLSSLGSGGHGGKNSGGRGQPIFHPQQPLKLKNKQHHTYTKSFFFKIYANDWQKISSGTSGSIDIMGFMTVIPWQALCMYMSPTEYIELIRNSSYAKIKHADFQLCFKAVRTPFDANSVDQSEANGNLQFELKRWDHLEMMMPFHVVDTTGPEPTSFENVKTYAELCTRLYGISFYQQSPGDKTWPATMRERGLTWRPMWNFDNSAAHTGPDGPMYANLNRLVSSLPVNEFVTEEINTNVSKMGEGYCFTKSYKPKNGILTMASSVYNTNQFARFGGATRINQKIRMHDNLPNPDNPITNASVQYVALYPNLTNIGTTTAEAVTGVTNTTASLFNLAPGTATVNRLTQTGSTDQVFYPTSNPIPNGSWTQDNIPITFDKNETPGVNIPYFVDSRTIAAGNPLGPQENQYNDMVIGQPTTTTSNFVTGINAAADQATNDQFWFGYNENLGAYVLRDLENYDAFTSNHDPPIHHMPSMLIGAIPKTNKDNTIVNATFEFEVKTRIVVEAQHVHPTYFNTGYAPIADGTISAGYLDPVYTATPDAANTIFRTRWQHNEHDVLLGDELKFWDKSYGLAAKPTFQSVPLNTPMLTKK